MAACAWVAREADSAPSAARARGVWELALDSGGHWYESRTHFCGYLPGVAQDPEGTLTACYRVTQAGLRELRRLHGAEADEEPEEGVERSQPRPSRRKREQPAPGADAGSG